MRNWATSLLRQLELRVNLLFHFFKRQPHESDNLDERIVTISCKRIRGVTRARPVKRVFGRG